MINLDELDATLEKLIREKIALSQKGISAASRSRDWLLGRLQAKIEEKSGPQLFASEPFIPYGSYYAGTKVSDADEFDVLVVIDSNTGTFSTGEQVVGYGRGSAEPNLKYDGRWAKSGLTSISPNRTVQWLKAICHEVMDPMGGEVPEKDGPAVTVLLKSVGLKIDLVPSGIFQSGALVGGRTFYNIPKGNFADDWVLTDPRADIDELNALAEIKPDIKNIIRLMKFLRDEYEIDFSSYAIQRACIEYAKVNPWSGSLFSNFMGCLLFLAERILINKFITDGFDPNINLLTNIQNLEETAEKFLRISRDIQFVLHAATSDPCGHLERIFRKPLTMGDLMRGMRL